MSKKTILTGILGILAGLGVGTSFNLRKLGVATLEYDENLKKLALASADTVEKLTEEHAVELMTRDREQSELLRLQNERLERELKKQSGEMTLTHETAITKLRSTMNEQISKTVDSTVAQLREDHAREKEELEQQHLLSLDRLRKEWEDRNLASLQRLREQMDRENKELWAEHEQEVIQKVIREYQTNLDQTVEAVKVEHANEKERMIREHQTELGKAENLANALQQSLDDATVQIKAMADQLREAPKSDPSQLAQVRTAGFDAGVQSILMDPKTIAEKYFEYLNSGVIKVG